MFANCSCACLVANHPCQNWFENAPCENWIANGSCEELSPVPSNLFAFAFLKVHCLLLFCDCALRGRLRAGVAVDDAVTMVGLY